MSNTADGVACSVAALQPNATATVTVTGFFDVFTDELIAQRQ